MALLMPRAQPEGCWDDDEDTGCLGRIVKLDGRPNLPCDPHFVRGQPHLQHKFCSVCRPGFAVSGACVRTLPEEAQSSFSNSTRAGFWATYEQDGIRVQYRIINQHSKRCHGSPLILFNGTPPKQPAQGVEWPELPNGIVRPTGLVWLRVIYGTLSPIYPGDPADRALVTHLTCLPGHWNPQRGAKRERPASVSYADGSMGLGIPVQPSYAYPAVELAPPRLYPWSMLPPSSSVGSSTIRGEANSLDTMSGSNSDDDAAVEGMSSSALATTHASSHAPRPPPLTVSEALPSESSCRSIGGSLTGPNAPPSGFVNNMSFPTAASSPRGCSPVAPLGHVVATHVAVATALPRVAGWSSSSAEHEHPDTGVPSQPNIIQANHHPYSTMSPAVAAAPAPAAAGGTKLPLQNLYSALQSAYAVTVAALQRTSHQPTEDGASTSMMRSALEVNAAMYPKLVEHLDSLTASLHDGTFWKRAKAATPEPSPELGSSDASRHNQFESFLSEMLESPQCSAPQHTPYYLESSVLPSAPPSPPQSEARPQSAGTVATEAKRQIDTAYRQWAAELATPGTAGLAAAVSIIFFVAFTRATQTREDECQRVWPMVVPLSCLATGVLINFLIGRFGSRSAQHQLLVRCNVTNFMIGVFAYMYCVIHENHAAGDCHSASTYDPLYTLETFPLCIINSGVIVVLQHVLAFDLWAHYLNCAGGLLIFIFTPRLTSLPQMTTALIAVAAFILADTVGYVCRRSNRYWFAARYMRKLTECQAGCEGRTVKAALNIAS